MVGAQRLGLRELHVGAYGTHQPVETIDGAADQVDIGEGACLQQRRDGVMRVRQHRIDQGREAAAQQCGFARAAGELRRHDDQAARRRDMPHRRHHQQPGNAGVLTRHGLQCGGQRRLVLDAIDGAAEGLGLGRAAGGISARPAPLAGVSTRPGRRAWVFSRRSISASLAARAMALRARASRAGVIASSPWTGCLAIGRRVVDQVRRHVARQPRPHRPRLRAADRPVESEGRRVLDQDAVERAEHRRLALPHCLPDPARRVDAATRQGRRWAFGLRHGGTAG